VNHDDGACPWSCGGLQRWEVNPPTILATQRVWDQRDLFEIGQKIKERVARTRGQDLVTPLAEEFHEPGIGLARAGGKNEIVG
jgi:hypothetical protein